MPTTSSGTSNSDLIVDAVEDLRKVLSVVKVGTVMSTDRDPCDGETFVGFCELLDAQLTSVHERLQAAMEQMDASQHGEATEAG